MSNDTVHPREGNDNSIVITINGQEAAFTPSLLSLPDVQEELRRACLGARDITFNTWHVLLGLPAGAQEFVLRLVGESPAIWRFRVAGVTEAYSNPLDATLNSALESRELNYVANVTAFAVAAAGMVCPGAADEAANRIRGWLDRNGIQSAPVRSIAAQIRRNCPEPAQRARLSPQDAARSVLAWLQAQREAAGEIDRTTPPVRYFLQEYYRWDGRDWTVNSSFELVIARILQEVAPTTDLTSNLIRSVINNIQAITLLNCGNRRLPIFIRNENLQEFEECGVLTLQNGIINIAAIQAEGQNVQLFPHNPSVFGSPVLGYDFSETATCPLWIETLSQIFPSQGPLDHRVEIIQEFFGYCLSPTDHRLESFVILCGDGANGKSVVLDILRAMLGRNNVSDVPLDAFGAEFRLSDMIGKLANIATDMQRMQRVQEGILKQLVSGEPVQINRKFKQPVTMYPTAKLIFATNHLPPFADTTNGLWRRMRVIPFNVEFTEGMCDLHRARHIIISELPGVLNWALAGLRRLTSQGAFTACNVCQQAKSGHRHDSDPFLQFMDECCEIREGVSVLVDDLYTAYRGYCNDSGRMPKAKSEFGKQMARVGGVERRRETIASRRYYVYLGLGLLPTVLVSTQAGFRTRQYQAPYRQELVPRPQLRDAAASSPETTSGAPDQP